MRAVDEETATSSLGAVLRLGEVKEREAYEALDWLLERQQRIENGLARRHLEDGVLVLYDVSSSYFEGRHCPLAQYGHSRDHRGDRPQIVYGLLCTREGLPVAVEVFDGNTADPTTLSAQIEKLKQRFGINRVVLVGDRGMITAARIRDDLKPAGWTGSPACAHRRSRRWRQRTDRCSCRCSTSATWPRSAPPNFPGERLIVCRNRDLAAGARAQARGSAGRDRTGTAPHPGAGPPQGTRRCAAPPRSAWRSARREQRKMAKHFDIDIRDGHFAFGAETRADRSARPGSTASMSIRTSVPAEQLEPNETVQAYKDLARVERAFRCMKTVDLEIRPIRHWTADARARPRLPVHARLSCRMASAPERWRRCCSTTPTSTPRAQNAPRRSPTTEPSRARQGQEGDQAQRQRLPRHELRRPHRPSRHADPQHHAHAARPQHRFTLHAKPTTLQEGRLQAARPRPTRPVTERPIAK